MSQPESRSHVTLSEDAPVSAAEGLRGTVIALSVAMLIFACVAATFLEFRSRSAHMAMANLPLAVLLPFVAWLLVNALLKRFVPWLSMTSAELRMALSMLWVGGSFAGYNWITQWVGAMAAPRYYASPENRWRELIFDYLPWWMFPSDFPGVTEGFFLGVEKGAGVPWGAWLGPVFWAMSAGAAMTAIGVGLTAVFQKQWVRHERLTYPLAQVPLDLTEGFDRKRGWPPFVLQWLFWTGFAISAIPLLWNLIEYWSPGFPRLAIFDAYYGPTGPRGAELSRYLQPFSYRMLPTVLGFTFLCDLNILFSIWSLWLSGQLGLYAMSRVGFTIGLVGQEAKPSTILGLFTHGVSMGLVIWTLWAARGHLKKVFRQVARPRDGEAPETAILSPRLALLAILAGVVYMVFWLNRTGYSVTVGLSWLLLFWASILVVMKFLAASGFAYLFPSFPTSILNMTVGANRMNESTLVGLRLVNWRLLAGWRLPAALPHVERLAGRPGRTGWVVAVSLVAGMLAAVVYTVSICYEEGGSTFRTWSLVGAPRGMYEGIAKAVADTDPEVTDPGKIGVWLLGGLAAGAIQLMQSRFSWWPLHPLGVMLMSSGYVRLYVLDIFLVWLAKLTVLRFGGISLYRRVKPVCYGLIVGYVFAVGCSFLVDLIWFPEGGHYIHGY
ncbi:MAG: hypothetical protein J4F39_07660 [Candidatus Latescibacteria bacterium]|nr:hypothetical protein [Candidatus Latescibacterota bacterium]